MTVNSPKNNVVVEGRQLAADAETVTTDDATVNTTFTDPNGTSYSSIVGLLAAAGYSSGDSKPLYTFPAGIAASVSSNTYTAVATGEISPNVRWDDLAPAGTQLTVAVTGRARPQGDQIDIRIQNIVDSETVVERTGITTDTIATLGPTDYTPTTTESRTQYLIELRNADNTTSVRYDDPTLYFGARL